MVGEHAVGGDSVWAVIATTVFLVASGGRQSNVGLVLRRVSKYSSAKVSNEHISVRPSIILREP